VISTAAAERKVVVIDVAAVLRQVQVERATQLLPALEPVEHPRQVVEANRLEERAVTHE
jgi:hypothetical protein